MDPLLEGIRLVLATDVLIAIFASAVYIARREAKLRAEARKKEMAGG